MCSFCTPRPATTSDSPCAAPDRSTELVSEVSVCISHGSNSSKELSPMPFTMAPSARADTDRTYDQHTSLMYTNITLNR